MVICIVVYGEIFTCVTPFTLTSAFQKKMPTVDNTVSGQNMRFLHGLFLYCHLIL